MNKDFFLKGIVLVCVGLLGILDSESLYGSLIGMGIALLIISVIK